MSNVDAAGGDAALALDEDGRVPGGLTLLPRAECDRLLADLKS